MKARYVITGATISPCGAFRYRLWRVWDAERPRLLWIMLNPSTADADLDDQTISTIVAIAKAQGYGGVEVVNLYAYRATSPKDLRSAGYPVGDQNDKFIQSMARIVDDCGGRVVLAWGNNGEQARIDAVLRILLDCDVVPLHISRTDAGQPRHPLYQRHDVDLIEWRYFG